MSDDNRHSMPAQKWIDRLEQLNITYVIQNVGTCVYRSDSRLGMHGINAYYCRRIG